MYSSASRGLIVAALIVWNAFTAMSRMAWASWACCRPIRARLQSTSAQYSRSYSPSHAVARAFQSHRDCQRCISWNDYTQLFGDPLCGAAARSVPIHGVTVRKLSYTDK